MSIHVATIRGTLSDADLIAGKTRGPVLGLSITVDGDESLQQFKQLVQRGANLWPDAHHDIKTFADIVTNDKVFQKYEDQNRNQHKPKVENNEQS